MAIKVPAATAVPMTPATLGPMACISRKLVGQMLFRGQNILGYRPYADDVVDAFVQKSIANGIDIIRIFDCLNYLPNLQEAVNATNRMKQQEGRGHAQVALSYTLGPYPFSPLWEA